MDKIFLGKIGEDCAEQFLQAQNYRTIKRNFRCRFGEIDLIALDGNTVVFVEVKTRRSDTFGTPQDSVTYSKKRKLLHTAIHFLQTFSRTHHSGWRMDLIAVELDRHNGTSLINHFKNILNG